MDTGARIDRAPRLRAGALQRSCGDRVAGRVAVGVHEDLHLRGLAGVEDRGDSGAAGAEGAGHVLIPRTPYLALPGHVGDVSYQTPTLRRRRRAPSLTTRGPACATRPLIGMRGCPAGPPDPTVRPGPRLLCIGRCRFSERMA